MKPTPNAGLGLAGPAHGLVCADAIAGKQDDLGPPCMLLGGVAILDEGLESSPIAGGNADGNPSADAAEKHAQRVTGIPIGIQASDFIH
jgi:hypothetical protein